MEAAKPDGTQNYRYQCVVFKEPSYIAVLSNVYVRRTVKLKYEYTYQIPFVEP